MSQPAYPPAGRLAPDRPSAARGSAVVALAALAALPALAWAPPARAQRPQVLQPATAEVRVNRANWTLADRFSPAALRAATYTNALQPRWLGKSDTLWYNWRDRNGSRFYLVVPATGTKRPLFDRELLAARLAEVSRKPVDPNNLPFTTLNFTKDHKRFRFTADSVRYEWSLATQTLTSLGRPSREPAADEEREDRGQRGGGGFNSGVYGSIGRPRDFRAFSPDSSAFVFARDHNLYVVEVGKPDTVQVTADGEVNHTFGYRDTTESRRQIDRLSQGGQQDDNTQQGDQSDTDEATSREMRVRPNVAWSPDSRAFAIVRQDQRKVGELYLVNVLAEPRPALIQYRYAMPGEENVAQSELWIYRRGDRAVRQLNVARWRDQQLRDVHWPVGSEKVRVVRRDRPQRNLDLVEVDVATNAVRRILGESLENASVDPYPVRYLKKGGDLLWWSERSGWGHYYVYPFDGGAPKRPLTTGAWHADTVVQIDSTSGVVWLYGMGREPGENPYYQHLYRVNGDGSGLALVDPGNFTHIERMSPTRRYTVDSYSRIDAPTKTVLRDATTGRVVMALEETDVSRLKEMGWRPPETFVVKAADGVTDIYGNIWKPFDFDSTKKYPIVAHVYPGPQTESILFPFTPVNVPQYLAQLGMIVIQIGNRGGSPQRSLAYHRYGYYNLRDYALADKKAGIEQLAARHPYIDLQRVGIYGHSGGGFLTAAAMLLPPYNEFFKVGWSESGNHDNNIYNQNWSEWNHGMRVMARRDSAAARGARGARASGTTPGSGPDAGAASGAASGVAAALAVGADTSTSMLDTTRYEIRIPTNEELAANLRGRLMLTTGDLDNNVHPGGTIRLANALIKANKRFDFFLIPGQPHGYRDMVNYTNHLMLEYFAEHLIGDYYRDSAQIH